jgi:hypothetical protein
MNSADIKREILQSSGNTGIRKRLVSGESGLDSNDIIEMGGALESLVKHKGWSYVESYILKNSNPVGLLFADVDLAARGKAQALILLMQWVQQTILAKNDLLEKQNAGRKKDETDN